MCLSPRTIVNPTKYISLSHADQMLLQVPCGVCAECQRTHSNTWFFRTWHEFRDCMSNGSFVQFDTLTYSPKHLPHISDFVDIPKQYDFSCFNPRHLRQFITNLNTQVERRFKKTVSFRYFFSTEYGSESKTFRPHYHVLWFVYGNIKPIEWSSLISELWTYGRTDGSPYKSAGYVLDHNTCISSNLEQSLRVCNYVVKYVQKSCAYQDKLNSRLDSVMSYISKNQGSVVPAFDQSFTYTLIRESLKRRINQFHRQSQHFGESALADLDLKQLFHDGCLYMPSFVHVKIPISLASYYKRKLFYDLVEVNGARCWQLNDLGREYKQFRKEKLIEQTYDRYRSVCLMHKLDIDCRRLANYVHNVRGRIMATGGESTIEQRYCNADLFSYITRSDKEQFGKRGFSLQYAGNSTQGYDLYFRRHLTIDQFIKKYIQLDEDREIELDLIHRHLEPLNLGKQNVFELKQRLQQLMKILI